MDISTQLDSIENDKMVNAVRASVAQAVWRLSMGKFDLSDELSEIRTAVYAPVIREATIRSLVKLLNYWRIDSGLIRSSLFEIAVKEYGRDLRKPLIDILESAADQIPRYEIDLGPFGYDLENCIFDAASGVVTPEDPGQGFGGSDFIPNVIESGDDVTVSAISKTGQTLDWCVLLYDESNAYLHDDTVNQGLHQWKPAMAKVRADFSNASKLRFFIRAQESGLNIDTIEAPFGYPDDEIRAGILIFGRGEN